MPKPLEYLEKFYKYAPYISAGTTALSMFDKSPETLGGIAGWLSGEDYSKDGYKPRGTMTEGFYGKQAGFKPTGAFGGFESKARDWVSSNTGYSWAGNLTGNVVNLVGELLSAPIELGFQARDVGKKIKGMLAGSVAEDIGQTYLDRSSKDKDDHGHDKGDGRPKHREISYGQPASIRKLAQARRSQQQQGRGGYTGGVYDPQVAKLLTYALHELSPTVIREITLARKARPYYDVGFTGIGRGKGVGK